MTGRVLDLFLGVIIAGMVSASVIPAIMDMNQRGIAALEKVADVLER